MTTIAFTSTPDRRWMGLIDRTGSWTLPFAGSIGLLLLGAGLAFRMHPDRPFEPSIAAPVPA